MALPAILAGGAALYAGFKMIGKAMGNDPDFTQAWMMNRMTGRGGFMKTFFADGMGKMFMGTRTGSAMMNGGMGMGMGMGGMGMGCMGMMGGMGMGMGMGGMGMMNPHMMNPMAMGGMPFNPMMMGSMMWGC